MRPVRARTFVHPEGYQGGWIIDIQPHPEKGTQVADVVFVTFSGRLWLTDLAQVTVDTVPLEALAYDYRSRPKPPRREPISRRMIAE